MSMAFIRERAARLIELISKFTSFRACASLYGVRVSLVERRTNELLTLLSAIGVNVRAPQLRECHVCDAKAEAEFMKTVSAVLRVADSLKDELMLAGAGEGIKDVVAGIDRIVVEVRRAKQS
ncbi:MAG: hypothetical protein QW650_08820 [Thermofilum sp.]